MANGDSSKDEVEVKVPFTLALIAGGCAGTTVDVRTPKDPAALACAPCHTQHTHTHTRTACDIRCDTDAFRWRFTRSTR